MSKPRVIKVTFIDPYESDDSGVDLDYVPSQTPESEDYSSLESSQYSTVSETDTESCISTDSSLD